MSPWFPSLPAINAESFRQTAESDPAAVILLWAIWDPTSRSLDTWLRQAQEGYINLHFYAMDLDQEQNWPLARKSGIMTTPSLVCLFSGVFHEMLAGRKPEPQMRANLSDWNNLGIARRAPCPEGHG